MPWEVYLRSVFVQRHCPRSFKEKTANRVSCNDFRCVCRCKSKRYCENFKCRVSTENLPALCVWHRRSSNCGEMFADSSGKFQVNVRFQVKVRFNLSNGRQKGQTQWIYIPWLGRCCWAAKSQRGSQSGWRREALPNKTLDKFKSFQGLLADSKEHHGLWSAISTLRFAPVPKHSCKTSHVSRMLTTRGQRS